VCSTHLMGGRFEDKLWLGDRSAGVNERVNQVTAIAELLKADVFTPGAPSIIVGDFNVMKLGFTKGPFVRTSMKYVIGDSMLYPQEQMERDYFASYVPHQTAVHGKIESLGYLSAYGTPDSDASMKTSRGGCPDWIYTKGVTSRKNERVISANIETKEGASDHNAIIVTLLSPAKLESDEASSAAAKRATAPLGDVPTPLGLDAAETPAAPQAETRDIARRIEVREGIEPGVDHESSDMALALFRTWDSNADGTVSPNEMQDVLCKLGVPAAEIPTIFAEADRNKDGRIDYKEFIQWVFTSAPAEVSALVRPS